MEQSGMPGKRWTFSGPGWTRTFDTAGAEAFLTGYGTACADKDVF